jgi:DNA-binding NtrC family response regulator
MNEAEFKNQFMSTWSEAKRGWECQYLIDVLEACDGSPTRAAVMAGIDRSNFLRLCRKHGVRPANFRVPKPKDPADEA